MTYFWVITLSWNTARGACQGTFANAYTPADGETRQQAFQRVLADAVQTAGANADSTTVLHFSMEPNQLGGAL